MVFAGPEFTDAGDGFRRLLVQRLSTMFHDRCGEIARVADLTVEQIFCRLIVGQRRLQAARKRRDAVRAFPHEGEKRIQAGDAARVTTLKAAHFIKAPQSKHVGARDGAVQKHDQPHSSLCQLLSCLAHGCLPGGRIYVRRCRPLRIGEPVAGVLPGKFVVLEVVLDGHRKIVLPETDLEVQWSERGVRRMRSTAGGRVGGDGFSGGW